MKSLILRHFFSLIAQRYAITAPKQLAVPIVATIGVIDPIAIANVEAVLGAIPPDRALHEPWKGLGEGTIELACVDLGREEAQNVSAPAGPIASVAVRMAGTEPTQDPGTVQEIMDQCVDGYERRADFEP